MDPEIEIRLRRVRIGCLLLVLAFAMALWANQPYLLAEHSRWNFWQLTGLWFSDIAAIIWFLRFAYLHAIQGRALVEVPIRAGKTKYKALSIAIFAALLIDLVFTLYLMNWEKRAYADGQAVNAQVLSITVHKRQLATEYELQCLFWDSSNHEHHAHLRVYADHHEPPPNLPDETWMMLQSNQPEEIRIRYDQKNPEHAWVDGLGWKDENGIYWISIGNICVQGVTSLIFLLNLFGYSATGTWPWWCELYRLLPLAAETFCMLSMGLIDRLMDFLN